MPAPEPTRRGARWSRGARRGSVITMDIGPVRRRFTAEPISSPVPGEESPVHELPARERVVDEHVSDRGERASVPATHT